MVSYLQLYYTQILRIKMLESSPGMSKAVSQTRMALIGGIDDQ